jgi:hypothetical protein
LGRHARVKRTTISNFIRDAALSAMAAETIPAGSERAHGR